MFFTAISIVCYKFLVNDTKEVFTLQKPFISYTFVSLLPKTKVKSETGFLSFYFAVLKIAQ